jgi:thioesterase domain-containing protein
LGRVDSKIRFRGQWIVPTLVEERLASCAGVDEAAVAISGSIGNKRLVAYVKYSGKDESNVGDLRRLLIDQLPAHSIPSTFITVQELPVTANGKIDRSALPILDRGRPKLSTPYAAPCSPLHQRLSELWCDVLELDQVGIRDDFFELGGDSLLAVKMLTGLEILTEQMIPPDILLGKATIEHLSDVLLQKKTLQPTTEILNADGELRPLFFLHGDYFSGGYYTRELAQHLEPTQPIVIIRPCGLVGEPVPSSYREMAKLHLEQIREVQPTGPYLLGGTCNGGLIAFEISQLLTQHGDVVEKLVLIDASASNLRYRQIRNNFALKMLYAFDARIGERVFLWIYWQLESSRKIRKRERPILVFGRLAIRALSRVVRGSSDYENVAPSAAPRTIAGNWARLRQIYQRIDHLYFPAPYGGSVVLLWPQKCPRESLSDVKYWWERVCTQIEFQEIPGDNITCLTRHVEALAHALGAALKRQ